MAEIAGYPDAGTNGGQNHPRFLSRAQRRNRWLHRSDTESKNRMRRNRIRGTGIPNGPREWVLQLTRRRYIIISFGIRLHEHYLGTCMLMLGRHLGFLKPESVGTLTSRLADAVRMHFVASRDAFYGFPMWKLYATSAYKNLTDSEETIYK